MKITLYPMASDERMKSAINFVWGGHGASCNPALYAGSDSILEVPEWHAFCEAPRSVALQLETQKKKYGFYLWMQSARPDRDAQAAKEYSREQSVKFFMKFTARGIIDISHYRLCNKAEAPTREFVQMLKDELLKLGDAASVNTSWQMMPMCAYRNGLCTELHGCGKPQKYMGQ